MENNTEGAITTRVSRFLFLYRQTPHTTTTGVTPAEILLGRIPRSHLDLLKPEVSTRVRDKQREQQKNQDSWVQLCEFKVGDRVFIKEFPSGKDWLPGIIASADGPRSFHINLPDDVELDAASTKS